MKLPSSCDLPFSLSGVNTTLLSRAATQPISAIVYPVSTIKFHGPRAKSGSTLCENQFAVARSNISVESIKNPQNMRTWIPPAILSSNTLFWPNQPVITS